MALTTVPASLSATAITLTTAAQPNVTSVGTLSNLTISGFAKADNYQFYQNSSASGVSDAIYRKTTATMAFKTGSTERMLIDSYGNLGVGTGNTSIASRIMLSEAAYARLTLNQSTTGRNWQIGNDGNNFYIYDATSAVRALDIKSDGKVGIGITNAESGLHLYDGTNVGAPQNANRRGTLIIEAGSEGSADIQLLNASYSHIFFGDGADPNAGMIWYQHAAGGSGADSMHFGTAGKADDITIKSNGFVGIGESNPARRLSVRRDTGITSGFNDISQFLDTTLGVGGSVSLNLGRANSSKNLGKMAFKYAGSGSNSNELNFGFYDADNLMTLTAAGNVSIGGSTAANKTLSIKGASNNDGFFSTFGTGFSMQVARHPLTGTFSNTSTAGAAINLNTASANSSITFWTHNTNNTVPLQRMTIDKDGNVGIGVPSPVTPLQVAGSLSTKATNGLFYFSNSSSTAVDTSQLGIHWIGRIDNANYHMTTGAGGFAGQAGTLGIGGKGGITFGTCTTSETYASGRMIIDVDGNVGIGTANPTETLEVAGTVKITNVSGSSSRLLLPNFWIGPVPNTTNNNTGAVLLVNLTTINANNVGFQFSGSIIGNSYTGQAFVNVNIVKHYSNDNIAFKANATDEMLTSTVTRMQLRLCTVTYSGNSYLAIVKTGGGTGTIQLNGYFQGWYPDQVTEVATGTYTVTTNHGQLNY